MKKLLSKQNGITIVILAITVVLLLILAAVTINFLGGNLMSGTLDARKDYKKENIIDIIRIAETNLEPKDVSEYNKIIDIASLMAEIARISEIKQGNDYDVITDEATQSATIIEKKDNIIVDIVIDKVGNVLIDGLVLDDGVSISKPVITYAFKNPSLDLNTGKYKVTIEITANDENGISKIVLPDNTKIDGGNKKTFVTEYLAVGEDTYKVTAENANGRITTIYIDVTNQIEMAGIVLTAEKSTPTKGPVNVTITFNPDPKVWGNILTNEDKFQYRLGDGAWETADSATITESVIENYTIYARYFDGANGYNTNTLTINNIDTRAPEDFRLSASVTTSSVTINGSTEDFGIKGTDKGNYGIAGYQFKLSDENGSVIRDWTSTQQSGTYTFNNLTHSTEYFVSMRAVDKAGNTKEAKNKEYSVILNTIPNSEDYIEVQYSPSGATKGSVLVSFINWCEDDTVDLKYQIDSSDGEWLPYTESIEMTENGIVYATLIDVSGQHNKTAVGTVNNIDREKPEEFELTTSVTETSITVMGETDDIGSEGTDSAYIGIKGYKFKLEDKDGNVIKDWTSEQASGRYTFTGLSTSTSYKVSMKAIDFAENERDATNNGKSVKLPLPDSSLASNLKITRIPDTATNGNVKVKLENLTGNNNLIVKYQINGITNGNWTPYTKEIEMNSNGTVYARLFDADDDFTNTGECIVNNLDNEKPLEFELSATVTENSISVTGTTEDVGSTGTATQYIGIQGYKFKLEDKNGNVVRDWTSVQTSGSYTFTGLTMGTTYKVSMKAIDLAGNEREASNNGTGFKTPLPDSSLASNLKITKIPDTLSKDNIKVKIENLTGANDLTVKYQIGGTEDGNWTPYTEEIAISSNGTVYARLFDENGEYNNTGQCTIDNIDKAAPNDFEFTTSATSSRITVTGGTTDNGSEGLKAEYIGIQGYQFKLTLKDGNVVKDWTDIQTSGTYSFSGLNKLTDYKISMRAVDKAGNITTSSYSDKDVSTPDIVDSSLEGMITFVYSPSGATKNNVNVTISNTSGDNDLILKYQVGGTDDDKWQQYTSAVAMTANGTIYARLFDDGGNYKNTATGTVNNIDREAPLPFEFAVSVTGESITIKAETTDIGSEGTAPQYIGAYMYTYKILDSNGTQVMSSGSSANSVTKTGLTEGATYYVSVIARDRANNETPASNNNYEVTLPVFPDCYVALYTDGTLAFSNNEEAFDQSLLSKSYGNIKNKHYSAYYSVPWYNDKTSITSARFLNEIIPISTEFWFYECENLTDIDFTNLDTSYVTTMRYMFYNCKTLATLDVSSFNTENVTSMYYMFSECVSLKSLDLTSLETNNVTDMSHMLYQLKSLEFLDITGLDTSKVTDFSYMFGCGNTGKELGVTKIKGIENLNTSSAINMEAMFKLAKNLVELDLSKWDTSKVTNMSSMFSGCEGLTNFVALGLDTENVTFMSSMFRRCKRFN